MSLTDFLRLLLHEGRVALSEPPCLSTDTRQALAVLTEAYQRHRLAVAGPSLDFDAPTALAVAGVLWQACWALVSHEMPEDELQKALTLAQLPQTPTQHLSADLLLRFVPQLHRRASALDPTDRLTELLALLIRQWPLSGVLSAVEQAPLTPTDFGGHPGLQMLYAERWAVNPKPAWLPRGRGFECLELVWADLGRDPHALPRPAQIESLPTPAQEEATNG